MRVLRHVMPDAIPQHPIDIACGSAMLLTVTQNDGFRRTARRP
jgi:hypothetical protein